MATKVRNAGYAHRGRRDERVSELDDRSREDQTWPHETGIVRHAGEAVTLTGQHLQTHLTLGVVGRHPDRLERAPQRLGYVASQLDVETRRRLARAAERE